MKRYTRYMAWLSFIGGVVMVLTALVLLVTLGEGEPVTLVLALYGTVMAVGGFGLLHYKVWGWWVLLFAWLPYLITFAELLRDPPSRWSKDTKINR